MNVVRNEEGVRICIIEGCGSKHEGLGYCGKHYKRFKKSGDPNITIRHGMHDTTEYAIWSGIKHRCNNPDNRHYENYGGRGIRMCQKWTDSFMAFYEDVGPRPSKNHSLDRYPNKNGDYEPNNFRWATRTQQNRNTRSQDNPDNGVHWSNKASKWNARIHANGKQIHLGYFDNKEDAIAARKKGELKYW